MFSFPVWILGLGMPGWQSPHYRSTSSSTASNKQVWINLTSPNCSCLIGKIVILPLMYHNSAPSENSFEFFLGLKTCNAKILPLTYYFNSFITFHCFCHLILALILTFLFSFPHLILNKCLRFSLCSKTF